MSEERLRELKGSRGNIQRRLNNLKKFINDYNQNPDFHQLKLREAKFREVKKSRQKALEDL